ncbi:MAG: response regulator transcription factor [Betaproteobacteria bacterium]|nr:response regulator transcription factor [Betaproteobacteria bacterium]
MLEPLDDNEILVLTGSGENELHEAGTTLTPLQLEALVLIDGHASVAQVLKRAPEAPQQALRTSLQELLEAGFVRTLPPSDSDVLEPGDFFTSARTQSHAVVPGHEAEAEAAANMEFLRQNGYCVNVVRRPKVKRERVKGSKPMVLVIDDDPDICSLLQMYLKLEGFESRTAGNRAEIIAELRRVPRPDAVLLDIHLPDADGFDVLHRMREHPALRSLPIIMLTGEANREAVLKGILGGADGYITKPFDIHHMMRAVKAVLGLKDGPIGQDWDYSL